jgi:hypothetical protein
MSQQSSRYTKVFIDSRWRSSGTHADFTIELPRDIDTSRTASVYVASCSFSNTFETIIEDLNDRFYFLSEDNIHAPPVPLGGMFYALYKWDARFVVTQDNSILYYLSRTPGEGGQGSTFGLTNARLSPGVYTGAQMAEELQRRIRGMADDTATVTWVGQPEKRQNIFEFQYSPNGSRVLYNIPDPAQLSGIAQRAGLSTIHVPWPPPPPERTVNWMLNMESFQPTDLDFMFSWAASSKGPARFDDSARGVAAFIATQTRHPAFGQMAQQMQRALQESSGRHGFGQVTKVTGGGPSTRAQTTRC